MRERRRVRAGVRDAEQLAQRGHLRLAVAAFDALGDVEDQVDVGVCEHARQVGRRLEVDDDVAWRASALRDRDDRLGRVVLGLVVARRVDALDVVGEADADRLRPCAARVTPSWLAVARPERIAAALRIAAIVAS